MPPIFDPLRFGMELGYTLIVVFLCIIIYFKTKEIYTLTKHKGIYYFRNTFLFFGAAYLFRLIFHAIRISNRWLDIYIPRGAMGPIMLLFTGFLSTMAILCLIYSTIWKKFSSKEFFISSLILAIIIAIAAALSPPIFLITQTCLLIIAIVLSCLLRTKTKFPRIFLLYFLLFVFWIISLILVVPSRAINFEIKLILEIISIAIFMFLYYKVSKWTR
ncbi:hypothetical protein JW851_00845 [Candidatus Woesearchaeota archaeon]|nr:hypothetical protein [Candidatus Woesearchaeota archaeon]